jgi:hypothetical protein
VTQSPAPRRRGDAAALPGATRAQRLRENPDAPDLWKASSPLVDLGDPKLRVRTQSLVQTLAGEGDKALALYTFVRRMPLTASTKLQLRSAREVLELGRGDATDKATLLIALLRIAGLPARVRFVATPAEALRGLPCEPSSLPRPFVEVWIAGRWLCTDTYIFDSAYVVAARQRLRRQRQEFGYGIHVEGATLWESHRDAHLLGADGAEALASSGAQPWRDPLEYVQSLTGRERAGHFLRVLRWNLAAGTLQRRLQAIRAEARRRGSGQERKGSGRRRTARVRHAEGNAGSTTAGLWPR